MKSPRSSSASAELLRLFEAKELLLMPCSHDALSARMIAEAGFPCVFISGFAVAASHGLPDTGLFSFGEVISAYRCIREALPASFPLIADGDTGFGNAMNVKRTVRQMFAAGMSCLMIEDQVSPKQCGHTAGKQVVSREEAVLKIKAATDAVRELRQEFRLSEDDPGILILARTDARGPMGLNEAITRCKAFRLAGAHATFLEAPLSEDEMKQYCDAVDGPKMANMLSNGQTPALSANELESLGYSFAAYPLDLLNSITSAMRSTLASMKDRSQKLNTVPKEDSQELWRLVGFQKYIEEEANYECQQFKKQAK